MYLILRNNGECSLKRSHNPVSVAGFQEMSQILESEIKIGTDIVIENENTRPKPHRGKYYLLFMQEFETVYLFYVDTKGILRMVFSGDMEKAVESIFNNIASDMSVKILKSSSKRAYRVVKSNRNSNETQVLNFTYRNKSSQNVEQVYLNLFEAINFASQAFKKSSQNITEKYCVITPKDTVLFEIGLMN